MRRLYALLLLVSLGAASACDDGIGSVETSHLTLLLTDAPGDFHKAVVTISQIYLQGSSETDPTGERVILLDEPVTTDLLTLSNNVATLAEDVGIASGNYNQLRFVIDGAYIEVETATGTQVFATPGYDEAPAQVDGVLQCPSCSESGIKVNVQGGLSLDADTETLLVDFDVAESFGHEAGGSGQWVMRPSIKASNVEAAAAVNVSLALGSGISLPAIGGQVLTLAGFKVELRSMEAQEGTPGESVSFADLDSDGVFEARFSNVLPGQYQLVLSGPAGLTFATNPAFPNSITVEAGVPFASTFTITSASPAT